MYRKPHHKFLQNFPVVEVSKVAMCVSSQISERVTGEGRFEKGFAMSSDVSTTTFLNGSSSSLQSVHGISSSSANNFQSTP
jgi:hypothetical protein